MVVPQLLEDQRERELRTRRWRTQHCAVVVVALSSCFFPVLVNVLVDGLCPHNYTLHTSQNRNKTMFSIMNCVIGKSWKYNKYMTVKLKVIGIRKFFLR
jgi:hypothetical protein